MSMQVRGNTVRIRGARPHTRSKDLQFSLDSRNQINDFFRRPGEEANIVARIQVIGVIEAGCKYIINRNPRITRSEEDPLVLVVSILPMIRTEFCYLDRIIIGFCDEAIDGFAEIHAEGIDFLEEAPFNGVKCGDPTM